MTTVEKLFLQIFDRRDSIVEQVKQQAELYTQHLASKLLIDGIAPPPWLWNPKFNSETSHPKELKKEELISELLLPYPQPAVSYSGTHCYPYNKPVITADNGELSDGLFMDTVVSNKGISTEDSPTTVPDCHDDDPGRALNPVPEQDLTVTSPQGQIEVRLSNIYTVPDRSLVRIQRSKSRQKALELRNSATTASKSHFIDENDAGVSSSGINTSRIASHQLDGDDGLMYLAKYSDIISDNGADNGAARRAGRECLSTEKNDKPLKLLNSSDMAKQIGAHMTRSQRNCNGVSKPVYSYKTASQRVTRSKSGASKRSLLVNSSNKLEKFVLQNETDDKTNTEGKADYVTETALISDALVEGRAACSESNFDAAGLSLGLEGFESRPPSDYRMFVKPKTLDFNGAEKCSLNENFTPLLEKEMLDKSSEKRCWTSVKSPASLDKITSDYQSIKSSEKQLLEKGVSLCKAEAWRIPSETCSEECVEVDKGVFKSDINKNLTNVEDNSATVLGIPHSPVSYEADVALSNVDMGPAIEMHQKVECHVLKEFESSPELQVEEVGLVCSERDRSETTSFMLEHQQLVPSLVPSSTEHSPGDQGCLVGEVGATDTRNVVLDVMQCCVEHNQDFMCIEDKLDEGILNGLSCSERTFLSCVRDDGLLSRHSVGSLCSEDQNFSSSRTIDQPSEKSLLPGRSVRSVSQYSWPQFKRRKIEGQQTNCVSASTSFRVKETHSIRGHAMNGHLMSVGDNSELVLRFQHFPVSHVGDLAQLNAEESPDVEIHQNGNNHLTRGIEPSPKLQLEEDELRSELRNNSTNSPLTTKHGKLGTSFVSSLTKEVSEDSHGFSIDNVGQTDTISIVLDVRKQCDQPNYNELLHAENDVAMENANDFTHTERILPKTKPFFKEDCSSSYSVVSLQNQQLAFPGPDQTMPEFEGFSNDTEENEQPDIVGNSISFDRLNLPSTTIERASVLEQLCKNASLYTPLSEFSTTFELHEIPETSYGCMDEMKYALQGGLYCDYVPYTDSHYGWSSEKPYMSPVGKLRDQTSSKSSSSEKQRSLNPELTCFPIEEDPSFSGENENRDEVADTIQEDVCSMPMTCGAEREPLGEITEARVDAPTSVSAVEKFLERSSLNSVNTEFSFTGTCSRVEQKQVHRYSNKRRCSNEANENHNLSVSTVCMKKATESLKNRFSKPKVSGKTSLRKGAQSLSQKESKHNNIVSNITSFVPLIQQKQAAAVGTGKRDIKVKALEAAEAVKHLEEKRQNERKMKKEALKVERARVHQENIRQMELKKKQKEEEQKKKDADMAARKRLREEEERKEKERKRKRIEGGWQQQRGGEEKLLVGKVEKEDKKLNNGKGSNNHFREHQKMENERGDNNIGRKQQTEPRAAESSKSNVIQAVQDCEGVGHCGDIGQPTSVLTKTAEKDDNTGKTSQERSYEISPFQCSDDKEDNEVDAIPTRKFIPFWASKNSVSLVLSSQQKVDPDTIFPPESFCSMDEVLRPQKLALK